MKYYRPGCPEDFFGLISGFDPGEYSILAGGTDLVPRFKTGRPFPAHLIDVKRLGDLSGIRIANNGISIGALTTIETIRRNDLIKKFHPALIHAANQFAGVQIRHRATIGGNICNASPAGDMLPGLYAAYADVRVLTPKGVRQQTIEDFIIGPGETNLGHGELLHSVRLPASQRKSRFYKLGLRQSMAISVINLAITWDSTIEGAKNFCIAAGSAAPTVVYLKRFTDALNRYSDSLKNLLPLIDSDISPITDIRAGADYRREVLKNVVYHELNAILKTPNV